MHNSGLATPTTTCRKSRPRCSSGCATRSPRVHCITNAVAQNFTANVLLAAGAVPSMTLSVEEIGPFVAGANALLVNLGTFDHERREADRDRGGNRDARQLALGARSGVHRPHASRARPLPAL